MNLLDDQWIPVRRRSSAVQRIAPAELTSMHSEDPVVSLASPRGDFDGSLVQFLIGLLQSACPPANPKDWRAWLSQPPSTEDLRSAFGQLAFAFDLVGEGPRFLQDLTLAEDDPRREHISGLLIDSPGENTERRNADHFVKRGRVEALCGPCSTMALLTLQTNAPSGGQGHRTGLRGGGPLTTLVQGGTLWTTVWSNVLPRGSFEALPGNSALEGMEARFPWLAPTRTSGKTGGTDTTPEDVHPLQMFWGMPRRIRLVVEPEVGNRCDLCGGVEPPLIREYLCRNLGVNYTGAWRHSLTPYRQKSPDEPALPSPAGRGGIQWRHWLGIVQEDPDGSVIPAAAVRAFKQNRPEGQDYRVWAFRYDMDNMKPRCWYEGAMPLILADEEFRPGYEAAIVALVHGARLAARAVEVAVRQSLKEKARSGNADLASVAGEFWSGTEGVFYSHFPRLLAAVAQGDDLPVRESFASEIRRAGLRVFDTFSQSALIDRADPGAIARAHNRLKRTLWGKAMREKLGLPAISERRSG